MSLAGTARGTTLRGKINKLHTLRGYSAYEIAVLNGFPGTEEEWLESLVANEEMIEQFVNAYLDANPVARTDYTQTDSGAKDYLLGKDVLDKAISDSHTAANKAQKTADDAQKAADDAQKAADDAQKTADDNTIALGWKAETETYTGMFTADGWSESAPYTQTIMVEGLLVTDYPLVDVDMSDVTDAPTVLENWGFVGRCTVSADDTVIAYCYEDKPEVDIPVVFKVVR